MSGPPALAGELASIMSLVRAGRHDEAQRQARAWRNREPGDVLAIIALGESLEAAGKKRDAARVYGSIIDLFPSRADLRRFAAGHLERLALPETLALAIDCLQKALKDRPDHPASHHLLTLALLKAKRPREAFEIAVTGAQTSFPSGRFAGSDRILREDLGLAAAAWAKASPKEAADIRARLEQAGGAKEAGPSVRFLLTWETDANDVDFHIHDGRGGHAFYSSPQLPSGGELYADVTTGYGPECFTVRGPTPVYPYRLQAHYYSRGPMGYGMGRLEVVEHDGKGGLRFESRPFVVMNDQAFIDLGKHDRRPRTTPESSTTVGQVLAPVGN